MIRVIVDDVRFFPDLPPWEAVYFRTLSAGMVWLDAYLKHPDRYEVELWLDHDLGGTETIRPLVTAIEEHLQNVGPLPKLKIRLITDNPAGRKWMLQALRGRVDLIEEPTPRWRVAEEAIPE